MIDIYYAVKAKMSQCYLNIDEAVYAGDKWCWRKDVLDSHRFLRLTDALRFVIDNFKDQDLNDLMVVTITIEIDEKRSVEITND